MRFVSDNSRLRSLQLTDTWRSRLPKYYADNLPSITSAGYSDLLRIPGPDMKLMKDMWDGTLIQDPERMKPEDGTYEYNRIMNSSIKNGLEWMMLDKISNDFNDSLPPSAIQDNQHRAMQLLFFARENQKTVGDEYVEAILHPLARFIPIVHFYKKKPWFLAAVRTWMDLSFHRLYELLITEAPIMCMAHLYEYNRLIGIDTPWITGRPKFEAFFDRYAGVLFWQGQRPQTITAWKTSITSMFAERDRSEPVQRRRLEARQRRHFTSALVLNGFFYQSPLGGAAAPSPAWWRRMQHNIDWETTDKINNRTIFDMRGLLRGAGPLMREKAVDIISWIRDHGDRASRAQQRKKLQELPFNGSWFTEDSVYQDVVDAIAGLSV